MPDDTPDKPLIQRILHQQPRRPFTWNIPTGDDEESPQTEDGSTIVNNLDTKRSAVLFTAGEAILCGDEMMISPEDGKVYRATQDAKWRLGPARRDYAADDYIVRDGRRSW